jgi:2-phosphosulfolactate phosphatase
MEIIKQMQIKPYTLETCHLITGIAVVIDVCRAFTTAAWAFERGAQRIYLSGTVEEALQLRRRFPGSWIMGEVGGLPVAEFELWNSPHQISQLDLSGKTIIQRTSSGTQGVMRCTSAAQILAASFVVASASICWIQRQQPDEIGFVVTGVREGRGGEEDIACANYMNALLNGSDPDPEPFLRPVRSCTIEEGIHKPELTKMFNSDVIYCSQVDQFDFAMIVQRQADLLVMERVDCNE